MCLYQLIGKKRTQGHTVSELLASKTGRRRARARQRHKYDEQRKAEQKQKGGMTIRGHRVTL